MYINNGFSLHLDVHHHVRTLIVAHTVYTNVHFTVYMDVHFFQGHFRPILSTLANLVRKNLNNFMVINFVLCDIPVIIFIKKTEGIHKTNNSKTNRHRLKIPELL